MDSLSESRPESWDEYRLDEVCELQAGPSGASLPSREFLGKGTPLVRPRDIEDRRISDSGLAHLAISTTERLRRYRLEPGDVVGTRTGTLGRFALVVPEQSGWMYSTQLIRIRPSDRVDPTYLVHYLALPTVAHWIGRHISGSTVKSITVNTLGSLPTSLPPLHTQRAIGASLQALDDKARLHSEISRTTGELHDVLAPMLFSGRAPIPTLDP